MRHSECKIVSKYMSCIKDVFAKIVDLKISISKAVVIYSLHNLDPHFQTYFAILRYNIRGEEKLPTLSELTKVLENEQMCLSNENKGIANYACSSKPRKAKARKQKEKRCIERGSDNEKEKKRREVKKCETCEEKHYEDCWHLNTKYFIYDNIDHIAARCPKKSNNLTSSSVSKKKMCYT